METTDLGASHSLLRIKVKTLIYKLEQYLVVVLELISLVDLQVKNIVFCLFNRRAQERILLSHEVVERAPQSPCIDVAVKR